MVERRSVEKLKAEGLGSAEGLSFREADLKDASTIAEIYNESIAAGDSTMERDLKTPEGIRQWIEGFSPRETILLLERGESRREVLGLGLIKHYSDRGGYRFACETAVFLHRSEVGKGYGSRIKWALIERCRQLRYHHMVARIFADNTASIEYNKKFGYELVGIQKEIGFRQGRWRDVAILQLILEDVPPEIPEDLT